MSILKVARLGHPVLRRVTAPLSQVDLQSAALQQLIDDMIETMKEYDGVGLAADQVHESKQLAVLEVADNPRYPSKPNVPLTVLANPSVTPLSDEMEDDWEGCLSVPELRGCHTQAKSLDTLMKRDREAIELCLEVQQEEDQVEFVGVQRVRLES